MRRVSKKQKRVRAKSKSSSRTQTTKARAKKILRAKALHLLLGPEHFIDRAAAEKLRLFPNVPRRKQSPFPRDVEVGFAGHYKDGKFRIQGRDEFVLDFETNAENAWYLRFDKRGDREPRREDAGMFETNAAMSSGLAGVLADLVREGRLDYVRDTASRAAEAGMVVLCNRTGYLAGYLSLHPDAEWTLSAHYGSWTVDPAKHELLGISATGKRGRKGPKNLGDCFISIIRHDRAIGLPPSLTRLPYKNLHDRDPLDWAIAEEMDRVVREELGKLPNGPELLKRADEYQREAAEDWLRRYRASKAGVDKQHAELEAAKKRIMELEASVIFRRDNQGLKKKLLPLRPGVSGVRKLATFPGKIFKWIGGFVEKVSRSLPVIEITYSMPQWVIRNSRFKHLPNPPIPIAEHTLENRGSRIDFETVRQQQVIQTGALSAVINTGPEKPQEPCQVSQPREVRKTSVTSDPFRIEADDNQMNM